MADKDKATETELNKLHAVVARVLREELEAHEKITVGGEEIEMKSISPAMVAQAIKFLKDNDITATPEEDKNIESLQDILSKKQKRSNVTHLPNAKQAAGEE